MDDIAVYFIPMGYAPWGIGNPIYLVVPIAFIALCIGAYVYRKRMEPHIPRDVEPECAAPTVAPELIAALAKRGSTSAHSADGSTRVLLALMLDLIASGDLRVSNAARDNPSEEPEDNLLFELATPSGLSQFQQDALRLLFPEGEHSITLDEWLAWFNGKSRHYDIAVHLMKGSAQAIEDAGLAKRRPIARMIISPLFLLAMGWSLFMVPAFAGVAGGVIAVLAVGIAAGTFGNTKPLITQAGADGLVAARANAMWARTITRAQRLPASMPHGHTLARALAAVAALGDNAPCTAIAELLERDSSEQSGARHGAARELDATERQIVLLFARAPKLQDHDEIDSTMSPAGRIASLLDRQQQRIEDR